MNGGDRRQNAGEDGRGDGARGGGALGIYRAGGAAAGQVGAYGSGADIRALGGGFHRGGGNGALPRGKPAHTPARPMDISRLWVGERGVFQRLLLLHAKEPAVGGLER